MNDVWYSNQWRSYYGTSAPPDFYGQFSQLVQIRRVCWTGRGMGCGGVMTVTLIYIALVDIVVVSFHCQSSVILLLLMYLILYSFNFC